MLIERSFAWWAQRAEEDDALPCTAGRPDAFVSHRAMATALAGPGPRLEDEVGLRWWLRPDLTRTEANMALNRAVNRMYCDYHTGEYERLGSVTLDEAELRALKEHVARALGGPDVPFEGHERG